MKNNARTNPFINRKPLETGGRDVFMRRLRRSLGHDETQTPGLTEPAPPRDEALIRQCAAGDPALTERWIERAKGNSISVHRVQAEPAAVQAIIDTCFSPLKISKVILNMGNAENLADRFDLPGFLSQRNLETLFWGAANCREAAFDCDAAITDCRAGLADAGSLLVWSNETFGRSSTLVVPLHIILLPASRILPDMIDGLAFARRENPQQLPSNIVVINGPSKTADIEMKLITGVHGPKFLHVILLEGI